MEGAGSSGVSDSARGTAPPEWEFGFAASHSDLISSLRGFSVCNFNLLIWLSPRVRGRGARGGGLILRRLSLACCSLCSGPTVRRQDENQDHEVAIGQRDQGKGFQQMRRHSTLNFLKTRQVRASSRRLHYVKVETWAPDNNWKKKNHCDLAIKIPNCKWRCVLTVETRMVLPMQVAGSARQKHTPPQEQHPGVLTGDPSMCSLCSLAQASHHKGLKPEGKSLTLQRSRSYSFTAYFAVVKHTSESTMKSFKKASCLSNPLCACISWAPGDFIWTQVPKHEVHEFKYLIPQFIHVSTMAEGYSHRSVLGSQELAKKPKAHRWEPAGEGSDDYSPGPFSK